MRMTLYTEKTVAQCMSAIAERLGTRGSRNMEGWVEKNGHFAISIATPIVGKIMRRTLLRGYVERQSGTTRITINVPSGADQRGQITIFAAVAIIAIILLAGGALVPALTVLLAGIALYIPLAGDNRNSPILLSEVQRTLKASPKPPKKPTDSKTASPRPAAKKPAAPSSPRSTPPFPNGEP